MRRCPLHCRGRNLSGRVSEKPRPKRLFSSAEVSGRLAEALIDQMKILQQNMTTEIKRGQAEGKTEILQHVHTYMTVRNVSRVIWRISKRMSKSHRMDSLVNSSNVSRL